MAAGAPHIHTNRALLIADNQSTFRRIGCNADGMLSISPWQNFGIEQDVTANDADKTFPVPAGKLWVVHWITAHYTATATAGNRFVTVDIRDGSDRVILRRAMDLALTANQEFFITFGAFGLSDNQAGVIAHAEAFPSPLALFPTWDIRIYDFNAIDVGADDMEVTIARQEIDNS